MTGVTEPEIQCCGVRALKPYHREIMKLKRLHRPFANGSIVWATTWLLIDFLKHGKLQKGARVMDVGCGWGLAGIYCAKKHNAVVTGVDIDSEVFPYLQMHAEINNVEIGTLKKGFDDLAGNKLQDIDVIIGSDICYWHSMFESLQKLIFKALHKGVQLVVIADPNRPMFDNLGEPFIKNGEGEIVDWSAPCPHPIEGRILKIGSLR